jgi:hypothetical protein
MKYVLWDLETELIKGPLDLDLQIPGITIGATLTGDNDLKLWYEQDMEGQATGENLSPARATELVQYLDSLAKEGHTIVTWNGAGFDFRVLAEASGRVLECISLAWDHVDMMFWFHCQKGFSIKLDSAAQAVGSGKTAGMSGADAPKLWADGQYERVQQYVAQDVRAAAAVYEGAVQGRALSWITSRGRRSSVRGRLLSVRDALKLPAPDTSWMTRTPWPREKFVGWMLRDSTPG